MGMVAVGSGEDVCVCPSCVVSKEGKVQWIVESCYRKDTTRRGMQICDKVTYNQIQISNKHFPPRPTTSLILTFTLRQSISLLKFPPFVSCSAHQRACEMQIFVSAELNSTTWCEAFACSRMGLATGDGV
jgi:hypothetical protein